MIKKDAIEELKRVIAEQGGQAGAAKVLDVNQSMISDLVNGRRNFSENMLRKLGLARVVVRL